MFKQIIKKYLELKAERVLIRKSIQELSALTDKELNDIGINRCDIPRIVVKGTKYGKEESYG